MQNGSPIPQPSRQTEIARLALAQTAPDTPLDQVFRLVCELSAKALDVERVGIWLLIDNQTVLRCVNLFERSKAAHSAGAMLRVADFPNYFSSLPVRKAVPAEVAVHEPWTAELAETYMKPLGITSMLDAGIFVEGTLVGVVCHEHVGPPREWTTEDRDFAGSVADLLAIRLQEAEVRELRSACLLQQERLAARERREALAQLAAGVAHDFRNLLTVFLGRGELLVGRPDLPLDARQQAQKIVDTARRGIDLTRELLEFTRPGEHPPAVIDLTRITAEFLPTLRATVGSRYPVHCPNPTAIDKVLMDKSQFTRLLLNLVVNARDAMPDGGAILIALTTVKLVNTPGYSGRFVLLEVSDQGRGVDEATRQRMFEPFFTTKAQGTGLGLAIVRQIVELAGGFIRVESDSGHGTAFRLFFPSIEACNSEAPELVLPPIQTSEAANAGLTHLQQRDREA